MKILNQTTRDTELPFETTPVTGLEKMDDLPPSSLMHIVRYDDIAGGYESRKMLVSSFQNKMYQAIQNTFKTEYIDTHAHGDDTSVSSFPSMVQYLGNELPKFNPSDRDSSFVQHVNYDFEILRRYIVKKDAEILGKIGSITKTMYNADVRFQTNMKLTTTDENGATTDVSVWEKKGPDQQYCQMQIQVGNKISNEWIVPASGNLVICGWLDSEKALNNKSIPTSYCVIEGKIGESWQILGVQAVIPGKSITYVGFTIPVKKELAIRARTGFVVGAKSGQFSNEQDGYDTVSNNVPNGFKCQVFSNENTDDGHQDVDGSDTHIVVDRMEFGETWVNDLHIKGIPIDDYIRNIIAG